jgi:ATP-dependent Clp protease ATP-binding subunit ClpB
MINPDRLTVKSAEALNAALALARKAGNPLVYDVHLLLALLAQDEGIVVPLLQRTGTAVAALRTAAEQEAARYARQSDAQPSLSRELTQLLDAADRDAKALGDAYVSTEHLLLALADAKGTDSLRLLTAAGAPRSSTPSSWCGAPTRSPTSRPSSSIRRWRSSPAT